MSGPRARGQPKEQKETFEMATHTIVTMPGDGIGKVVLPESLRVLDKVGFKANYVHGDIG